MMWLPSNWVVWGASMAGTSLVAGWAVSVEKLNIVQNA